MWVLRTDGTDRRVLTQGSLDGDPAWSPDGKLIAFTRQTVGDFRTQLMTVSARGGGESPLMPKSGSRDFAPAWSSDGREVAFIRAEPEPVSDQTPTVWVVGADGTNARSLAAVPDAQFVEWNPDGESLLVSSARRDGSLSLVDVNTGDVRKLADHATLGAWFPDTDNIVYFTKEGARKPSWWRLARARVDSQLERESFVGDVQGVLYLYFVGGGGIAASPCGP